MLQVMVYAIAVAVLLGAAGLCMERLAVLRGLPQRNAWIAAMLLSILLPLVMVPRAAPPAVPTLAPPLVLRDSPPLPVPPLSAATDESSAAAVAVAGAPAPITATPQPPGRQWKWRFPRPSDRFLLLSWALASLLLAGHFILSQLQLARRMAGWQHAELLGQSVLVSECIGPALVGSLRPRIVVPRWLLQEPLATQSLILQHEREHMAARDPLLIRAGMLVLVALPWNLPLWWQWHRLRQAIELDCDARVLRAGVAAQTYGETLLAVVGRAAPMPAGAVAMSEPVSALERRIRSLLPDPVRYAALQAVAALALAALGAGMAIAMDAPAMRVPAPKGMPPVLRMERTSAPTPASPVLPAPAPVPMAAAADAAAPTTAPREPVQTDRTLPATTTPDAAITVRDRALRAAVQRYPQLVNGPAQPGVQTVMVVLHADGTVYQSSLTAGINLNADPDLKRRMDVVTGGDAASYGSGAMAGVVNLVLSRRTGRVWVPDTADSLAGQVEIPQGQQIADLGKASSTFVLQWRVLPADYGESREPAAAAPAAAAPADHTAQLNMALRAAVQRYPELLNGPPAELKYYVTMVVRADGSIFRSSLQPPMDLVSPASYGSGAMAGVANQVLARSSGLPDILRSQRLENVQEGPNTAKIPKGERIGDLGKASADIELLWRVLPADYDESRDSRRVTSAVRAKHDELMLAATLAAPPTHINLLTVFMNEAGQIEREAVELLDMAQYRSMDPQPVNSEAIINARGEPYTSYNPPPVALEAFRTLGLDAAQIGRTGLLLVVREPVDSATLRSMPLEEARARTLYRQVLVRYAWPRRPGESAGGTVPAN